MNKGIVVVITFIIGSILGYLIGFIIGYEKERKIKNTEIELLSKKVNKFKCYYNTLNEWMIQKNNNMKLEEYFIRMGYQTIAIYGWGELGKRLYEDIKHSSINVKYVIDRAIGVINSEPIILDSTMDLTEVDAIIVSAIYEFDEIAIELKDNTKSPIISLEVIIFSIGSNI